MTARGRTSSAYARRVNGFGRRVYRAQRHRLYVVLGGSPDEPLASQLPLFRQRPGGAEQIGDAPYGFRRRHDMCRALVTEHLEDPQARRV